MSWERLPEENPDLQAAFEETADLVGQAFARAIGRYGYAARGPRFGVNPNDAISRYVDWWLDIPSPYEGLSSELNLLASSDGPEVSGRIAVWTYRGHGFSDDRDLWRSDDERVESPAAAITALRQVGAELARRCEQLDLAPYLRPSS